MTATDELRRLLDERGVPWRCYGYENHTWWGEWHAENRASVNGLFMKVEGVVTPEQAVEATLGRGTCRFKTVIDQDPSRRHRGNICECSECGYRCAQGFIEDERFRYCPNCGRKVVDE